MNDRTDKSAKIQKEKRDENCIVTCKYIATLFPPKEKLNVTDLQITHEGVYSITSYKSNLEIIRLIKDKMKSLSDESYKSKNNIKVKLSIMDATACVGGDTIGFGMNFDNVISIEKNIINYKALINNIKVYKLNNVLAFQKNFIDYGISMIDYYKPDILYFDPPWGGKDYTKTSNNKMELFLDTQNIKTIIKNVINKVKLVALKIPKNFNCSDMNEIVGNTDLYKLKKFNLLIITNK
jgi:hypothetical protein